ncbi:MAG: serine/threonine protein phosphatase PrpC [Motiliproteus sp.]|jgi:serine/threonine protein phosphatase PrpC
MNSGSAKGAFSWQAVALTDIGRVRRLNEDALLARSDIGHFVVADGMGGHTGGDVASQRLVCALSQLVPGEDFALFVEQLEDCLLGVNAELLDRVAGTEQLIGTTVAGLLLHQGFYLIYWCGDSRIYLFRDGRLRQQTVDHSYTQALVEQGRLRPDQVRQHPDNNMITRAVGADRQLFVDMDLRNLQAGDQFLICSDGLDKELDEKEIEAWLTQGQSQGPSQGESQRQGGIAATAQNLLDRALARGGRDNVTLILVNLVPALPGAQG